MKEIILPELSYKIMGILFAIHRELGPVQKEKNYQDAVEVLFKKNNIKHEREKEIELEIDGEKIKGFFLDFLVENKLILELKAKKFINHEDIRQMLRYLKSTNLPLAIIANFKRKSLEYRRLINPEVVDDYKIVEKNNSGNYLGHNLVNSGGIGANIIGTRITSGRILGIDFGEKNIGLAISDTEQRQAFVYDTLKMSGKLIGEIKEICDKELIDAVVVGLPLGLKGEYTAKTEEVIFFMNELEVATKLPVDIYDERLSSAEADKTGSGHQRDEEAARIILQAYLDKNMNYKL